MLFLRVFSNNARRGPPPQWRKCRKCRRFRWLRRFRRSPGDLADESGLARLFDLRSSSAINARQIFINQPWTFVDVSGGREIWTRSAPASSIAFASSGGVMMPPTPMIGKFAARSGVDARTTSTARCAAGGAPPGGRCRSCRGRRASGATLRRLCACRSSPRCRRGGVSSRMSAISSITASGMSGETLSMIGRYWFWPRRVEQRVRGCGGSARGYGSSLRGRRCRN